jgi:prepilin-type N-terminal cleavage/methylation domain-containing protein
MNKLKGFTIIELIVVIAIIGVLATIVFTNISQYVNKSRVTTVKADMQKLLTSATEYINSNGDAAGFCVSADTTRIADTIKGIDLTYAFKCFDSTDSYIAYTIDEFVVSASVSEGPSSGPGSGDTNCSSDTWYSYTSGMNNSSGCWCVDYLGALKDSCTISNCACQ